jgi:hypothetical protein
MPQLEIEKLYFDILPLVCRRFVAYILSPLSCGKLRNKTTASPVSALEIVAVRYICRLTQLLSGHTALESRLSFWFCFFVCADRIGISDHGHGSSD